MITTAQRREWFAQLLEDDGLSEYRDVPLHHHRVDWVSRGVSIISMALVGFAVVSAALGVARSRPQVTAEREQLRARVIAEQELTSEAEARYIAARDALAATQDAVRPDLNGALAASLDTQGGAAAYVEVRGPGIVVTLDDSKQPTFSGTTDLGRVIDRDVQHVVNALWQAGVEAVTVNDIRLTVRTSIRNAGSAILVDYKPVSTPVTIKAIAAPARTIARFKALPEWDELAQLRDRYRIRWTLTARRSITMAAGTSVLPDHAQPEGAS